MLISTGQTRRPNQGCPTDPTSRPSTVSRWDQLPRRAHTSARPPRRIDRPECAAFPSCGSTLMSTTEYRDGSKPAGTANDSGRSVPTTPSDTRSTTLPFASGSINQSSRSADSVRSDGRFDSWSVIASPATCAWQLVDWTLTPVEPEAARSAAGKAIVSGEPHHGVGALLD